LSVYRSNETGFDSGTANEWYEHVDWTSREQSIQLPLVLLLLLLLLVVHPSAAHRKFQQQQQQQQ
jgi:hypothetical protein